MSSRKIRYYDSTAGTTVTAKVTLDKTKKYKLNKTSGAIEEVTTTNVLADDELTIPGSKSALRRLGDLERNVSILASKAGVAGQSNLDTDTLLKTGGTISGNLTVQGSTTLAGATLSGDLTVNGGDIVLGGTGRIQGIDTVSASTDAASKGYVDNAVSNLVNSAPAALDTLNELAAALGNDANFSTTMTNALAGKASTATTISAGTDLSGGGSLAANRTISHAAVARTNTTSSAAPAHSGTFTVIDSITTSSTGHITGVNTKTVTLPADNNTTYGAASSTVYGLVKLEDATVQTVAANAVSATASRTYGVQVNSSGQLVVNVPWVDTNTNTTYTAGNGLTLSGTTFAMSGSFTGSFTATGDITAYSDDRLKTDIATIDGALDKVAKVRGVNFTRKADGSRSTGVVAQELQAVLPEAVHTDANGMHHVAYGNITGLLIEAIKELKDEVDYLKGLK